MPSDIYRASVRGAARAEEGLIGVKRAIQSGILEELRLMGDAAVAILRGHAPKDTSELADSLEARLDPSAARPRLTVTADAHRDGFDYLPLTRFGHETGVIRAAATSAGGHAAALAVHVNGRRQRPIFRSNVLGYWPPTDWVEDASGEIEAAADQAEDQLGRRIESRAL